MEEEKNATLSCELSKPGLAVEWKKGQEPLQNSFKYQIRNRNGIMELAIKNTQLGDSGLYSCNYGDIKTTANITVTREGDPNARFLIELSLKNRSVNEHILFPSDPLLLQNGSEEPGGSRGRQRVPAL